MRSKILPLATALMLSLGLWPAPRGGYLRLAAAPTDPNPPPPPPVKLLYMIIPPQGFKNPSMGTSLLNKAIVQLDTYSELKDRIIKNYLGETCKQAEGEICVTVSISEERDGNVVKYQVLFACKGNHSQQEPVDAERISTAAPKIARAISLHDQVGHKLTKP